MMLKKLYPHSEVTYFSIFLSKCVSCKRDTDSELLSPTHVGGCAERPVWELVTITYSGMTQRPVETNRRRTHEFLYNIFYFVPNEGQKKKKKEEREREEEDN